MRLKFLPGVDRNTRIAILAAVLCCACVFLYMWLLKVEANEYEADVASRYGADQIEVVVAKRDIAGGETISDSDVEVKRWTSSELPSNPVYSRADCVGKQLSSSVLAGEVVSFSRFEANASALDVPSGKDAISIPLEEASAVGGALMVGQKVDVYATGNNTTAKICSNVQILETSNSAYETDGATKWITIAVDKDRAQEVVAAAQKLELYVALPSQTSKSEDAEK